MTGIGRWRRDNEARCASFRAVAGTRDRTALGVDGICGTKDVVDLSEGFHNFPRVNDLDLSLRQGEPGSALSFPVRTNRDCLLFVRF